MTKRRGPDTYRRLRLARRLREQFALTGRRGRDYTNAAKAACSTHDKSVAPKDRFYPKAAAVALLAPKPPRQKKHATRGAYNRFGLGLGRMLGAVEAWKRSRNGTRQGATA